MKKAFLFTLWIIFIIVLVELVCYMLTASDTLMNIIAPIIVFAVYAISYETKCFTRFINKKEDENNQED